jgi:hypothetical protein
MLHDDGLDIGLSGGDDYTSFTVKHLKEEVKMGRKSHRLPQSRVYALSFQNIYG